MSLYHRLLMVTRHGKQKLAALALALLLWVGAAAEERRSEWVRVPLKVEVRDPRFRLAAAGVPRMVEVRIAGRVGDLIRFSLHPSPVHLVVLDADLGSAVWPLRPHLVRVPARMPLVVQEVRPDHVHLPLARQVAR